MTNDQFKLEGKRVWVAGHRGMVGSAIVRRLADEDCDVLMVDRSSVDLTRQVEVEQWMEESRPEIVIVAAAKVGGIYANDRQPADFLYDNLMIEVNVINAAWQTSVSKLLFLGSSCIYPKHAPQPMAEDALLTGPLESTNQWYAVAKIAGIKLCQAYRRQYGCDFISAMPTNLYGRGDNFDLLSSHVLPALMRKVHEAKLSEAPAVEVWGSGKPLREFLYVADLADACIFLLKNYSGEEHINVGSGVEVSIGDLARLLGEVIGFEGRFVFDTSKPDGTPRKLMDATKLSKMGWRAPTGLREGIEATYHWFLETGERNVRKAPMT